MLVRASDFVVDMKGSILGTTYQRGRYGLIRRAKPNPTNPQTTRQQERRTFFGSLSSAWRSLTEEQRLGWRSLAEEAKFISIFGEPKSQTGNTLFIALNSNLLSIGIGPIEDAPAVTAIPLLLNIDAGVPDVSTGIFEIGVAFDGGTVVPANTKFLLYATPGMSAGINAPGLSKFRIIRSYAATTDLAAEDIATVYTDLFAFPAAGQKVFLRGALIQSTTGFNGVPFQSDTIAVP